MSKKIAACLLAFSFAFSTQAFADDITVSDAWSRASAPGQKNGFVGLLITSTKDARLTSFSTTSAATTEIHTMSMDDGVMKMRELEYLPLPANETVTLGPGGDHLMLFDLKKPLKAGDTIPLKLVIEFADKSKKEISVTATVKEMRAMQGHHKH